MPDKKEIDSELSRLIVLRTNFFRKRNPTPADIQEFEEVGKRIQDLFISLVQHEAA